jgi:hypothetical protein
MASYASKPESEPQPKVTDKAKGMVRDVAGEVQHEASHISANKEPVDPTQSDHVVRRHVPGLSITFFVVIALFLVLVIVGFLIYTHAAH